MDITVVKQEDCEEAVKVEERNDHDTQQEEEISTPMLEDISHIRVAGQHYPLILNAYGQNSNGNLQITEAEDGTTYTYVIENEYVNDIEYHLAEGEHYIIEEYHGDYEDPQDSQYETLYVEETIEESAYDEEFREREYSGESSTISEEIINDPEEMIENEETVTVNENEDGHQELNTSLGQEGIEERSGLGHISVVKQEKNHVELAKQSIKVELNDNEDPDEKGDDAALLENLKNKSEIEDNDGKNCFECSICGRSFKSPTNVKRHLSLVHLKFVDNESKENTDVLTFKLCSCCGEPTDTAHTMGDFKCEQCDKLFVQQNSLDRHISIDHPKDDIYVCVECKKTFNTRESLVDHIRVHPIKSVKCNGCGREFTRKYHLDRHIGQTGCTGVPKSVYDCRVCGKSFTRKDNLADHLRTHIGILRPKKMFCCEYCDKEFTGHALLNIHVRTHTGEKPYPCDICSKKFPSSGAMKKHRRMHTGEKPYICSKCDKRFAAKETLNRHWRTHTGEKPHQCNFCGKSFIQASQLRAHIFHHTGENAYTCKHCGRAFNRKLRLTTHIKFMHEGAAPLTCPHSGCDKTFFRKEDIARHVVIHSGEKAFECDICKKRFAVKSSLKIHKLIHRKEPPVSCETCGRAFIRQDCLMRHIRARHRDVLEDIMSNAEKKRLQKRLLEAASSKGAKLDLSNNIIWNELTLTELVKELLTLLVDEECLVEFGHPDAPVDRVLDSVIRRCGHEPASQEKYDYIGRMRENAKLLFTVVIDDQAVKELLNNQTVDEVILHVLRLAKKQDSDKDAHISENEMDMGIKETHNIDS